MGETSHEAIVGGDVLLMYRWSLGRGRGRVEHRGKSGAKAGGAG